MTKSVVVFFAREHGLNGMQALVECPRYELKAVFTHKFKPRSEDPNRGIRDDFHAYEALTREHGIPLYTVDSRAEANLIGEQLKSYAPFDFIAAISWRRLIPKDHLGMPRISCVNLHRGKLPEYAGAEPVVRSVANREQEITITAHVMVEEIDAGEVIAESTHSIVYDLPDDQLVTRLKKEITPYFGPLLIQALDAMHHE